MLRNYVKLAFRNLVRHRSYALINILGLSVGLACFLLIARYVQHELSYESFLEGVDDVYRVVQRRPGQIFGGSDYARVTPAGLANIIVDEYPEAVAATTVANARGPVGAGQKHFTESGRWADARFFRVFPYRFLQGDPATALSKPDVIVLTKTLAARLFGDDPPIGKTLTFGEETSYTVTAVVEDPPSNTDLPFSFVLPISRLDSYNTYMGRWGYAMWSTYVRLHEGSERASVEGQLIDTGLKIYGGSEEEDAVAKREFYLQPLRDVHLRSEAEYGFSGAGDIRTLYVLSSFAVVMLLLACVNYTNLTVARSVRRAREVGVRKVAGARRYQLLSQFLGEAILVSILALVLGLLFAYLALPIFNALVSRELVLGNLLDPKMVAQLGALAVVVGLVAGSYPAFIATSIQPASVLKGSGLDGIRGTRLRRLLVVVQFAAAIMLVAGSLVVYSQMRFLHDKDAGYDRNNVIVLSAWGTDLVAQYDVVKQELLRDPNVVAVTASTNLPTWAGAQMTVSSWDGSTEGDEMVLYHMGVTDDFLDVYRIEMAQGRFFDPTHVADTTRSFVLNETAVKLLGWKDPIGKRFGFLDGGTVIGVVKDFNLHSLQQPTPPLVMYSRADAGNISIRLRPGDPAATIDHVEQVWSSLTDHPFAYQFVDEAFDRMYRTERKLQQTLGYATLLTLFIAALGLFGLATLTAEQRTKEIGIRKVMGASVRQIVGLLTMEFTQLVGIAFVLAVGPAYYLMHRWLEDFTYRIGVSWTLLLGAGIIALVVAVTTISYQAFAAATTDPVDALRYE